MPRYFFNIRDGRDIFDSEGCILSGRREVQAHMMTKAMDFFEVEGSKHQGDWVMEAVDEAGKIIATLTFAAPEPAV